VFSRAVRYRKENAGFNSSTAVVMKIDNRTLWLFADAMATCLAAGLPPQRALELSGPGTRSQALGKLIRIARQRCDQGMSMSEALAPGSKVLPHYFLPVIRAGEAGGRLVEAFQLLHQHCRRIAPSARLVRNSWLYPLSCIVFGWIIRLGIFLYFDKPAAAWHFFWYSFGTSSLLVLAWWVLLKLHTVKARVDSLLLQIPVIREAELGLGTVLFFSTFRLAYEAGGLGVVAMFDLACQTIRNSAIRQDWLKARRVLEQHGTFADAFGQLTLLEDRFKGLIATGSVSGQLEQSLTQLVASVTQQLEFILQSFNNVFQRLVSITVAMSIVETVMICTLF
jgi:type II secretory pathway component PulF